MRTSPHRTRPSSTVRVSQYCQYRHNGQGTALMLSGQPVMIMSVRACILGSLTKACWNVSFLSGDRQAWWMVISSGYVRSRMGAEPREWVRQDHFLTGVVMDGSHSPGGTVAWAVGGLVCLPGSSGRWISGVCGMT